MNNTSHPRWRVSLKRFPQQIEPSHKGNTSHPPAAYLWSLKVSKFLLSLLAWGGGWVPFVFKLCLLTLIRECVCVRERERSPYEYQNNIIHASYTYAKLWSIFNDFQILLFKKKKLPEQLLFFFIYKKKEQLVERMNGD